MEINNGRTRYRINKDNSLDKRFKYAQLVLIKQKRAKAKKRSRDRKILLALLLAYILLMASYLYEQPEPGPMRTPLAKPQTRIQTYKGIASYYSHDGCIGCRADQLMANGERFDENALTIAFNDLPLNTEVEVTNNANGYTTFAKVTDTGGFNALGRIADLSLGVKNKIKCTDLCDVTIQDVKGVK